MISIIIPTYNEAENIHQLITYLKQNGGSEVNEIIVSDGGSKDATIQIAAAGAIAILSPPKGRAAQMNFGASQATGTVFYFIHADTFPPESFVTDIKNAIAANYDFGRYRTVFGSHKKILQLNAFFTRFDWFVCYGGDQTLFIKRNLFGLIDGFNREMLIMEDYDIVQRAKQKGRYKIIQKNAWVSARKYETNTWWQVQKANYLIVQMFKKGATEEAMVDRYKTLLTPVKSMQKSSN